MIEIKALSLFQGNPTLIILKTLPEKDKIVLHNELIRDMQQRSFLDMESQDEGHKFFKLLSNALWYLDGHAQTISETAKKRKHFFVIPNCDTQKVTFFILHFYQNSFVDSSHFCSLSVCIPFSSSRRFSNLDK